MHGASPIPSSHTPVKSDYLRQGLEALNGNFLPGMEAIKDNFLLLNSDMGEAAKEIAPLIQDPRYTILNNLLQGIAMLAANFKEALDQSTRLVQELFKGRMELNVVPLPPGVKDVAPFQRMAVPIDFGRMVVVYKLSKLELDMRKFKLTRDQLIKHYKGGEENIERIVGSHERQKETLATMRALFPQAVFMGREHFNSEVALKASLVVALGGDNHMQWVSHYVGQETPLLGINSDYLTSHGALLNRYPAGLKETVDTLKGGCYRFEPWTRLTAEVDGKRLPPALCEVFLGEALRKDMSRHTLKLVDESGEETVPIEQKGSGLLITTGSGSTGWFDSASRFLYPNGAKYSPAARYARFIVTEPSATVVGPDGRRGLNAMASGILLPDQELVIKSLNDGQAGGVTLPDSEEGAFFSRGSVARVRIAPEPLWVVKID